MACLPAGHHRHRSSATGKVRRLPSQAHPQHPGYISPQQAAHRSFSSRSTVPDAHLRRHDDGGEPDASPRPPGHRLPDRSTPCTDSADADRRTARAVRARPAPGSTVSRVAPSAQHAARHRQRPAALETHVVDRLKSSERADRRSLNALLEPSRFHGDFSIGYSRCR